MMVKRVRVVSYILDQQLAIDLFSHKLSKINSTVEFDLLFINVSINLTSE